MIDELFGTADLVIASTFVCVVLAAVVWSRVRSDGRRADEASGTRASLPTAAFALAVDWMLAAMTFAIGVLLGVALDGLIQLVASGAWIAVSKLAVFFVALFLIARTQEWLGEKLFPSGIRPARTPGRDRKTSRVRRLSLPAGLALGVIFAELGLKDVLSGWLL
jgi:hypothetical protein